MSRGRAAKAKGAAGERQFCQWLRKNLELDFTPKRNLEQTRSGGADIIDVIPYCIEIKRAENLDIFNAWCQVVEAAREMENNPIPIVAFRKNHQKWQACIPASFLDEDIKGGYLRLTEIVFRKWIRSHYFSFKERNANK